MLAAPAGLPDAIADRLNAEVARVLADPDVRRRLLEIGFVAVAGSRAEAAARVAGDLAKWRKVVSDIGFAPQ
jgi:tripartite-type tricarboxylate transporter receptor subunit TctC